MCEPATLTAIGTTLFSSAAAAGTATAGTAALAAGTTAATAAATALTTTQMVSLGLSAASAVAGVAGAYNQSKSARQTAEANAATANTQAQDAIARGDKEADAARRRAGQMVGAQRTAYSARGIDVNEGTAADMIDQTDFFGQSDQATAKTNARKEAFAYKSRAAGFQAQADTQSPWLSAGSGLLSSAGSVADKWFRYSSASPAK